MTEIMTKNRETKSLLAKLMASEDINVEYRESATTAAFDTEGRTLIMPVLKDMTENSTDLFLGHEVGHALYTPQGAIKEVVKKGNLFKGVVNIVEDARIEKMIQSKFPGLKSSFYKGYGDLMDRGFFDIKGQDVSDLNFIDRINIHFKMGTRAGINFTDEEMTIVDKISNLRSWDDTLKVSEELYGHCKDNAEEPNLGDEDFDFGDDDSDMEEGESNDGEMNTNAPMDFDEPEDSDGEDEDGSESGESDEDSEENAEEKANAGKSDGDEESDDGDAEEDKTAITGNEPTLDSAQREALKSETQEAFDEALENHLDDSGSEYHYGNIPKVDIAKVLVSMAEVHKEIDETIGASNSGHVANVEDYIGSARESFSKFRTEQKSIISYMAKEFEMRKSADEHSRTREGKTGVLNPNKLHAYKFSEDLFLRSNIVADGKNHGFVMFVDWSGSMAGNMANTIDQLTLLALFCKKVNIPFDVFAFTTSWKRSLAKESSYYHFGDRKDGDFGVTGRFSLLHLISSTLSTAKFNTSMVYLRYLRESFGNRNGYYSTDLYYPTPSNLSLGGTPLNEAVIAAMEIVPMFQKKNNVQIVNTIFLTDGQGTEQRVTYSSERGHFDSGLGHGTKSKNIIVDPITKRHYQADHYGQRDTSLFLEALKGRTGSRVAGFFIAPSRKNSFRQEISWIVNGSWDKINELHEEMKKNSFAVIEGDLGYDQFYVLSDKGLDVEAEAVEFDSDMTKGRMKNAFVKSRKNKIANKAMLSRFAEFVS
ncbi:MAG: hypothetical protein QGH83_08610 [Candidatus Pacebacteria bacterium]|nr:hypothetical protein [Candidatus Paceibacterota bacterium]